MFVIVVMKCYQCSHHGLANFRHNQFHRNLWLLYTGVLVVQALTSSDASITARIIESIDNNGPTTWMELSQTLSLSITLAKQYLMQAERAGKLCRDESEEGVRFHINRFPTFN